MNCVLLGSGQPGVSPVLYLLMSFIILDVLFQFEHVIGALSKFVGLIQTHFAGIGVHAQ